MRTENAMRENCFGWWLADIDDARQSCSRAPRDRAESVCLVCRAGNERSAAFLRSQRLVSRSSLPSKEDLFDLVRSGRLPDLERHQNVLETIFGAKSARFADARVEESVVESATDAPPFSLVVAECEDVDAVDKALDDALRSAHMDAGLVRQVERIRKLRAELSRLKSTSHVLHKELQGLDSTASRILSSVRTLRRDVNDLCFLERVLAAADGSFPPASTSNLII